MQEPPKDDGLNSDETNPDSDHGADAGLGANDEPGYDLDPRALSTEQGSSTDVHVDTAASSVIPVVHTYIAHEPRCTFCNYSLLGLRVEEHCPECGKPIWDSNIQPPTSGFSITSMVLGIVGLVSCMFYGVPGIILGAMAMVFAHLSFNQVKAGERAGSTRGFAKTGMICGIVSLALGLLFAGFFYLLIMSL